MNFSLGCVMFLLTALMSLMPSCDARPPQCKEGLLYEESIFGYIKCSLCDVQSHYKNCKTCCPTLNHTSGQNDQTLTTSVQPLSHRPITTALEDEESSVPSEHKSRFLTKEILAAVAVAFFLGLIAGGILLHMFKRCVDFRNRRSRESPRPPQQETQPSLTASPLVVVGSPVSAENTDMPVT